MIGDSLVVFRRSAPAGKRIVVSAGGVAERGQPAIAIEQHDAHRGDRGGGHRPMAVR
jgi:hypothetical protein